MVTAASLAGKNVLLTGGTGFVGRHVLPRLLESGACVTCLVRGRSRVENLAPAVSVAQADLLSGQGLEEALGGQDVVIHMAALLFGLGWQDYLRANALAARSMAGALERLKMRGGGPARVVLVSSLAATGPGARLPGVGDDAPCAPVSAYGWSKLLTEQILGRALGDGLVTLRPPIIYGSGDRGLLPVFRGVARGVAVSPGWGREFWVSAVHARDMAQAVLLACGAKARGVYHLSDGHAHTMTGFCQGMARALGTERTLRVLRLPLPLMGCAAGISTALAVTADAVSARLRGRGLGRAPSWNLDKFREARQEGWLCDASRIGRELGFVPAVNLEEGMAEAVAGYRREGWL